MKSRPLGNTELKVSEVGLGCWQFGGDFGPIDKGTVSAIIDAALTAGINFFDTADVYGAGASERYLGDNLKSVDPAPIIATKYGRGPGTYPDGYSFDDLKDSVSRAQDRLRRDRIDLLQLHCIPIEVLGGGAIWDWLRRLQSDGAIRYFGASVESIEQGKLCLKEPGCVSLQVIFNLFRQRLADELFPEAKEKGVGIIVRLPLASGLLSGKYSKDTKFPETDHRHYNRDGAAFNVGETFSGMPFELGVKLVDELKEELQQERPLADIAMRWILDHDAVSSVIPGASKPEQIERNARAASLSRLPEQIHRELRTFYEEKVHTHIRGEI